MPYSGRRSSRRASQWESYREHDNRIHAVGAVRDRRRGHRAAGRASRPVAHRRPGRRHDRRRRGTDRQRPAARRADARTGRRARHRRARRHAHRSRSVRARRAGALARVGRVLARRLPVDVLTARARRAAAPSAVAHARRRAAPSRHHPAVPRHRPPGARRRFGERAARSCRGLGLGARAVDRRAARPGGASGDAPPVAAGAAATPETATALRVSVPTFNVDARWVSIRPWNLRVRSGRHGPVPSRSPSSSRYFAWSFATGEAGDFHDLVRSCARSRFRPMRAGGR